MGRKEIMILNEVLTEQINDIARQPQNESHAIVVHPLFDTTLNDFRSLKGTVVRSSHLGNDYPSNQAFVGTIPAACFGLYDRTTGRDRNYFPWQLRRQNKGVNIAVEAPDDLLAPFFQPNECFFEELGHLPAELHGAKTPAQLHFMAQRMLHAGTHTYSQWILENKDAVEAIADVVGQSSFGLFDRQMTGTGRVRRPSRVISSGAGREITATAARLAEAVVDGELVNTEGLMLHKNEFNIYLDTVVLAMKTENQIEVNGETWGFVLHGAGPDMIKYATGLWKDLSAMHGHVLGKLPEIGLPRKIFFGLIPTAELKLALLQSDGQILDQLAEALSNKERVKALRKGSALSDDEKQRLEDEDLGIRQTVRSLVADPRFRTISFAENFSTHLSQYDVLDGGPMYFPEGLKDLTFRQIKEINNTLNQQVRRQNGQR